MKVLLLAPRYPVPPQRGDQRRALHLAEELAKRVEVTLLCFGKAQGKRTLGGARLVTVARSPMATVRANARHLKPGLPLQTRLYLDQAMVAAVARELDGGGYDVVHAITARMAPYLQTGSRGVHRHLDLIDALSVNMATRAAAEHGPKRALFQLESALLRRYEAAMVSAADSSSLVAGADQRAAPGLDRAVVIPMGVDLDRFPFAAPVERSPTLLFFGNLGYFHNVEPARFLAHEVIPLVRRELPDARLRIAGARPAKGVLALADLPGVDVVGPVDDMLAELHRAGLAVLPIFTGSGIKMKVLESFTAGTPVVSNARGVDGVAGAKAGTHYLAGESAADLANACVTLLQAPERALALATAGRALIETRYTWAAQVERLLALYLGS